jgi:membrane-bound inhibitor of C-type lysozyme
MTVHFASGRFVVGTGTINGRPAEPDEHEVRAAWRQAEAVKARIAAARAAGVTTADPNTARYACADGSVFALTFDVAGARAVVEFLGREPIVLPRVKAGSRFVYANDQHRLNGEGEEALWAASDATPVPCTIAAGSTPLRLASGNYPLFLPAARSADDWSRLLFDLMPAIGACLREPVGDLPRVIKAWPMSQGMVGSACRTSMAAVISASPRPTARRWIRSSCWGPTPSARRGRATQSLPPPMAPIRAAPASATSASKRRMAGFLAGCRRGPARQAAGTAVVTACLAACALGTKSQC